MARERFDHAAIEKAAQKKWEAAKLYEINFTNAKDPYYLLFEFPYPSGDLHIGHWYAFALTDIYARLLRMQGKDVLFPMGFDAFGLPAENAAMKYGKDPKAWTYQNMETMRAQVRTMGLSVDWSKEVVTCDPEYYRWTQWLFAKLVEAGHAERKEAPVKWCPKDQTVLANEQVNDGACERCGTPVEEKKLTQWFMKITEYAERLLADLEPLPWREDIKEAQRQWIGKSEGAHLYFNVSGTEERIKVFTTRADTVFGATYVVLAPEHPLVAKLEVRNRAEVEAYIAATKKKTERERSENKEKTGVKLEGITAVNPATKEEIPVFVADYVLASYGTGAVMAVPAHDERDFEFAKKNNLEIRYVIRPYVYAGTEFRHQSGEYEAPAIRLERILSGEVYECLTGDGVLIHSKKFDGYDNREVLLEIIKFTGGEAAVNYRIRDWLVSRQRYWGCPIPMVYDPAGKPHYVGDENLPWLLPEDVDFTPTGEAPLASSKELKERVTRIFGEGWTPEYDTLDTFVDSSWYFYRYLAPHKVDAFTDAALLKKWLPVNRYSGGSEHTTMHLLYARFFHKALADLGLVEGDEPFYERFNRGLILGPDGQKMSKSKGNVINPDEQVKKYGADAVRMYLAFIGPYNEPGSYPFALDGVEAMRKFLDRIDRLWEKVTNGEPAESARRSIAKAAAKIAEDTARFKLNTAVSALMVLMNELEKQAAVARATYADLIIMLAPYAPHLAEHLWERAGGEGSVHTAAFPKADAALLTKSTAIVIVQINGKKRGEVEVAPDADEAAVFEAAKAVPAVAAALTGGTLSRQVYVKGRLLNLVIT